MAAIGTEAAVATIDPWIIDADEVAGDGYYGISLANGVIGIRSAARGFDDDETVVGGAWAPRSRTDVPCGVTSFGIAGLELHIDGRPAEPEVHGIRQRMDYRRAVLTTEFEVGDALGVTRELRALRHLPHTALAVLTLVARRDVDLELAPAMRTPSGQTTPIARPPLVDVRTGTTTCGGGGGPIGTIVWHADATTPTGALAVGAAQILVVVDDDGEHAQEGPVGVAASRYVRTLTAGQSLRVAVVGSTLTSEHVGDPGSEAVRLTLFAASRGIDGLVSRHESAWAELWSRDILVDDPLVQRDVHGMLYHLYAHIRAGSRLSIAPMGLTRTFDGYHGHIFWDAETWMLPALLALHPDLARSMLDYRIDRLPAARRRAARHGYSGAMFPWESAATGDEDTVRVAPSGPFEIHITADIALAAWNYYRVTRDVEWLRTSAYPLLAETAAFWMSAVEPDAAGVAHIRHVVAADEYAEGVDDDAFTNGAAIVNLRAAASAARVLGVEPDPGWERLADAIPVLQFPDGVTREHAAYEGETIKQADVNLLAHPLGLITDPVRIRRDVDYYRERVDLANGPAMTKSVLALLLARLGETDEALEMFRSGYEPNLRGGFRLISENATHGNPYFVTAAGGLLQTLVFGFAGLRITDDGIVRDDVALPAALAGLRVTGERGSVI